MISLLRIVRCLGLAAVLVSTLLLTPGFAQDEPAAETDQPNLFSELEQHMNSEPSAGFDEADIFPGLAIQQLLDADGKAAMQQSLTAYYDYRTQGFEHRSKVFSWQHISTIIIFGMVMLIVFVGLYFSWMQFRTVSNLNDMKESTVEFGKAGIKVTSPVLGVIILALSLAFFYLYLIHVYPVFDTF